MAMPEAFHQVAKQVNNWGRWGPDDERGTLNFLTDEVVRGAAGCIRHGRRFPLAIPMSTNGPQTGMIPGRVNPMRTMISLHEPVLGDPTETSFSDDVVVMGLQAATHWDSLAHASYDGRIYNGHPASSIDTHGAARCGIDKVGPLMGRGVLLDVARALSAKRLEPGYQITPADLDAAVRLTGLSIQSGDILLVRTGQMQLFLQGKKEPYIYPSPGLTMVTAPWLHSHDVAAVAIDTLILEVFPGEREDAFLPVHLLHLVEMGLTQGQNFDLEALAADCAADGVYEFWLEATPQPFVAGLGGPVAPVAVK
jgi:kynurenine formamidase